MPFGIDLRVRFAAESSTGLEPKGIGQFIHGAFKCQDADRVPWSAHRNPTRGKSKLCQAMPRKPVGRGNRALAGCFRTPARRTLSKRAQLHQPHPGHRAVNSAVAVGAEPQALLGSGCDGLSCERAAGGSIATFTGRRRTRATDGRSVGRHHRTAILLPKPPPTVTGDDADVFPLEMLNVRAKGLPVGLSSAAPTYEPSASAVHAAIVACGSIGAGFEGVV